MRDAGFALSVMEAMIKPIECWRKGRERKRRSERIFIICYRDGSKFSEGGSAVASSLTLKGMYIG